MRLSGRVALVTGGASGIGKAIAIRLQAEGARVFISDVDTLIGQSTAQEQGFTFFHHDVCDEAQWLMIADEIIGTAGHLDVLVNNAGITGPGDRRSPEVFRLEDWQRIFAVNVEGTFIGCRTALAAMRGRGGAIINIASIAAMLATPTASAYGASKAAVRHLTRSIAQYCLEENLPIRCNSVHPGNVLTDLWRRKAEEQAAKQSRSVEDVLADGQAAMASGDFVLPEDVAAAVAYLASDEARQINGEKIVIDGGSVSCDTYFMSKYLAVRKEGGQ